MTLSYSTENRVKVSQMIAALVLILGHRVDHRVQALSHMVLDVVEHIIQTTF